MTEKSKTIKGNRIYFLDNLRTFIIFLVVLLHCGLVYESSGVAAIFWIVYDFSTNDLVGVLNQIMDIFVMATIFFVSGYLTPHSLKTKKGVGFLKTKFKRLMIPWVIAVLTLMPLYKFIYLYSRDMPQQTWTTYFHWNNGIFSQNWLWFLPVLFLFNVLYFLFSRLNIKLPDITLKSAVPIFFLIGFVYSFCMDIFQLQGWTKNALLNSQNERILIYFMVFLLGALCNKLKIFGPKWKNKKLYFVTICTAWIPIILYYFFNINSSMNPGNFIISEITDKLLLWLTFHLSLLFLLYVMINTFRYFFNKQGRLSKVLNQNSYHVYIIHTVVLGAIAVTMINTDIPSILKFLILTVSTYAGCNLLVTFYKKLNKKWRKIQ